ncbi:hypothetical protein SEA_HOLT_42 [Mycobacterium Phage Holt]|uniref:Uncharacterized protein n=1 Tax=Mycobacterium Phage BigBubba TaxID=3158890 RepID=A0AAU8GN46_9CAUD|nr:hypothetical protein SEA_DOCTORDIDDLES_41 [Mycobacterium phage DoctorDiddles]QDF17656.1 hypothetical protein SEA_CHOTABHAI_41 [Mycobacterium phage ChotaBhai]WNM73872.1 hypothetical protein SEA_HOLT_42 [Mycobacterium Phage Holt]
MIPSLEAGPRIGDYVFLDSERTEPATVVAVRGEQVWYVRGHPNLLSSHKGNMYDFRGERPWYVQ